MKKTQAKFHNNRYKTVRGVALTRGTSCLYIHVKGEEWLHNVEKVAKNALTIISKKHMQSFKLIGTKLQEELHSQEVPIAYILRVKND